MIEKVLFDLDGTLWDTQKFHAQIEARLMAEHGVHVDPATISSKYAGIKTERVFMEVMGCSQALAVELSKRKFEYLIEMADQAQPMCNLNLLFSRLFIRGIGMAIGTASPSIWAKKLLDAHRLSRFFQDKDIIGREKVSEGKPNPEVWIKAAGGTPLSRCLVVEDGIAGIEAAVSVGIRSVLLLPQRHSSAHELANVKDILHLI